MFKFIISHIPYQFNRLETNYDKLGVAGDPLQDIMSSFDLNIFFFIISFFMLHVISETAGNEGKDLFLREIEFMKQIGSHRNVLSMLGYWVKSEPIMLILEYASHGDLLQWLRSKRQQVRKYRFL